MVNRITRKSKGGNKNKSLKKLGGDNGEKESKSFLSRFIPGFRGSNKPPLSQQEGESGKPQLTRQKGEYGEDAFSEADIDINYRTGLNDTHTSIINTPKEEAEEAAEARLAISDEEATRRDAAEAVEQKRIADIVTPIVKKEVFAEVGQSLKGINDRVEKLEADINMLQGKKEEPVSAVKPVSTEEGEEEQVTAVVEEPVSKVEEDDGDDDVMNQEDEKRMEEWVETYGSANKDKKEEGEEEEEEKKVEESKGGKSRRRRRRSKGKSRRKRGRR